MIEKKEKGDEKLIKKRMISMLLCGIIVLNFSGTNKQPIEQGHSWHRRCYGIRS